MIHGQHAVVRRHRNLWGIALRAPTFAMMGRALWRHRWAPVAGGVLVEASLWTVMPQVEVAPGPIEDVIDVELRWLNAPASRAKRCSLVALAAFAVLTPLGLWKRSPRTLAAAGVSLLIFQWLMHHVAGRQPSH